MYVQKGRIGHWRSSLARRLAAWQLAGSSASGAGWAWQLAGSSASGAGWAGS
ncbi:MAG TPA: hypothetical protein VGH96_15740 [Streptosporangiaceae bacterium]